MSQFIDFRRDYVEKRSYSSVKGAVLCVKTHRLPSIIMNIEVFV